jgi:hypothetical protein
MSTRHDNWRAWLLVPLLSLLASTAALALSDADVKKLQTQCEAVRTEAMAPIRAQKTQSCIDQQLRSKGHCERYYTTYGNVSPGPSGAAQSGYFYDLPECQAWLEARDALRVSRSKP